MDFPEVSRTKMYTADAQCMVYLPTFIPKTTLIFFKARCNLNLQPDRLGTQMPG